MLSKLWGRPALKPLFLVVSALSLLASFWSANGTRKLSTLKRTLPQQISLENALIAEGVITGKNSTQDMLLSSAVIIQSSASLETARSNFVHSAKNDSDQAKLTGGNDKVASDVFPFPIPDIDESLAASGDLVLGMAQGIPEANLAVFVVSLRKFSACHIVFFMDIVSERTSAIVKMYNVTAIPINMEDIPQHMRKFHPSTYRWMMKKKFITKYGSRYKRVLLTDVRDTVFQGDPFEIVQAPGYYIFKEKVVFENEGWNKGWVRDCFGDEMVQKLSKELVVCSGVSMGTTDAIALYLELMSSTMSTAEFAKCERNGVDQGVHNVLSYTNRMPTIHAYLQSSGPVAHMQNTDMQVLPDWSVKAPQSSSVVRIVHQYDRNKALQNELFRKYVTWDLYEQLSGTGDCQGYTLKKNVEMFKGIGDFDNNNVPGLSAAECCRACNGHARCRAFTFVPGGGCWLKDVGAPNGPAEVQTVPNAVGGWRAAR